MQLVLDDKIGRRQRLAQTVATARLGGTVEPALVVAIRATEERTGLTDPRQ